MIINILKIQYRNNYKHKRIIQLLKKKIITKKLKIVFYNYALCYKAFMKISISKSNY